MYKTTEQGVKKICYAVAKGLLKNGTLSACRANVSAVLASLPWMDVRMKADVAREAEAMARKNIIYVRTAPWAIPRSIAYGLDGVMKAFNRSYRKAWKRTAHTYISSKMKLQRERDVVFYLVSSHQHPQKAHEPLQGTVLIDRYWREATDDDLRVSMYVQAHKPKTVQWAMGAPHYLITRPNCRHYLIPLRTKEVIGLTEKALKAKYQKKETGVHRPLTEKQRWQAYKELRATVLSLIEKLAPMKKKAGI